MHIGSRFALGVAILAATGVAAPSFASSDLNSTSRLVSPKIVRALDHATPQQQAKIYRSLSPAQQYAVRTPGKAIMSARVTRADGTTDDLQQVIPTGSLGTGSGITVASITNRTAKCGPYYTWLAGNTLYRWHDDIQWTWNCQTIKSLDWHNAYPSDLFFLETYQGKVADTMAGAGATSGHAQGTGKMAACIHIGPFDNCWASTVPSTQIEFDAGGGWYWNGTS
jgi:hypothetical protein